MYAASARCSKVYAASARCSKVYAASARCSKVYAASARWSTGVRSKCTLLNMFTQQVHDAQQVYYYYKKRSAVQARLRESDIHPISPKTPAPQYQPINRKKRKGKIVEDYSRDRAAWPTKKH